MIYFGSCDPGHKHSCERESEICLTVVPDPATDRVTGLEVDRCVVPDLEEVWANGIRTKCSCCGHGTSPGFIVVVADDAAKMAELGYKEIAPRYDHCSECGVFFQLKQKPEF